MQGLNNSAQVAASASAQATAQRATNNSADRAHGTNALGADCQAPVGGMPPLSPPSRLSIASYPLQSSSGHVLQAKIGQLGVLNNLQRS